MKLPQERAEGIDKNKGWGEPQINYQCQNNQVYCIVKFRIIMMPLKMMTSGNTGILSMTKKILGAIRELSLEKKKSKQ